MRKRERTRRMGRDDVPGEDKLMRRHLTKRRSGGGGGGRGGAGEMIVRKINLKITEVQKQKRAGLVFQDKVY